MNLDKALWAYNNLTPKARHTISFNSFVDGLNSPSSPTTFAQTSTVTPRTRRRSKVARAKTTRAPRAAKASGIKINKAEFIRAFPKATPAAEIVAAAKAKGLALTTGYVYGARRATKATVKRGTRKAANSVHAALPN